MNTLKVISALLCYPDQGLFEHGDELSAVIRDEAVLPESDQLALTRFIEALCAKNLMDAQSEYVETFDRSRSLSLLLFEHVHGESRDRGQAMVDLMKIYEDNGFEIAVRELPDFIPLFLEYLSQRPEAEIIEWLGDVQHILALLRARLENRRNAYSVLFSALLNLIQANVDMESIQREVSGESRDDSPEALDEVWEEEMVTFGADKAQASGVRGGPQEVRIPVEAIKVARRTQ
ncbi:MAG: nitrate reductase molybdenum cofactor assembly chaperone [Methylococcaceae bacterium]|nr:nitrate reductase molybdenum cofactor assembly chaperone [Methylococcaceae bacterium]